MSMDEFKKYLDDKQNENGHDKSKGTSTTFDPNTGTINPGHGPDYIPPIPQPNVPGQADLPAIEDPNIPDDLPKEKDNDGIDEIIPQ